MSCASRNYYRITVTGQAYRGAYVNKGRATSVNGCRPRGCRLRRARNGENERDEDRTQLPASPSCRSTSRRRTPIQPRANRIIRPRPKRQIGVGRLMASRPSSSVALRVRLSRKQYLNLRCCLSRIRTIFKISHILRITARSVPIQGPP